MTDQILNVLLQGCAAGFIGPAFAMLFAVPKRFLPLIGIVAALTRMSRACLLFEMNIVAATFAASVLCSLIFIFFGPHFKTPRPVFTVPCVISMIPGADAYNALLSLTAVIKDSDPAVLSLYIAELFHCGMRAMGIIWAIAMGLAVPPLFFYKSKNPEFRHQTAKAKAA